MPLKCVGAERASVSCVRHWYSWPLLAALHLGCGGPTLEIAGPQGPVVAKEAPSANGSGGAPPMDDAALEALFAENEVLAPMLAQAESLRFQVLVGVASERDGKPVLERKSYRLDAEYFYPASAIKLCMATLALEKLADLRRDNPGLALDAQTPLRIYNPITKRADERDPSDVKRGKISLAQEIRKALIVSDNMAFTRLYDFVGFDETFDRLSLMGFRSTRIRHRLTVPATDPRDAPRMELLVPGADPVNLPARRGTREVSRLDLPGILVGEAYIDEQGRRVAAPMSFAERNRVSVEELQEWLVRIARPELAAGDPLHIDDEDRELLMDALSTLPSESKNPVFERSRAFDELHKPLLPAFAAALPGDRLHFYSKGGRAYGFTVENVYVVDDTTHRSLFLTAVVQANSNQVINDDQYDYDRVSGPVLVNVAKVVAKRWLAQSK
jgi:hypothetical protein